MRLLSDEPRPDLKGACSRSLEQRAAEPQYLPEDEAEAQSAAVPVALWAQQAVSACLRQRLRSVSLRVSAELAVSLEPLAVELQLAVPRLEVLPLRRPRPASVPESPSGHRPAWKPSTDQIWVLPTVLRRRYPGGYRLINTHEPSRLHQLR